MKVPEEEAEKIGFRNSKTIVRQRTIKKRNSIT